jgi:hypothetical protein
VWLHRHGAGTGLSAHDSTQAHARSAPPACPPISRPPLGHPQPQAYPRPPRRRNEGGSAARSGDRLRGAGGPPTTDAATASVRRRLPDVTGTLGGPPVLWRDRAIARARAAGCYFWQVDGDHFSYTIVFRIVS